MVRSSDSRDQEDRPTTIEFRGAGYGHLLSYMRKHGGLGRWAEMCGRKARKNGRPKGPGRPTIHWTYGRIRTELLAFCKGRDRWPTHIEFKLSGNGRLLHAVRTKGGVEFWMREMGFDRVETLQDNRRSRKRVTRAQIRAELTEFLAGHDTWPPHSEFRRHKRYDLLKAMEFTGGIDYWAKQMGLPRRSTLSHPRKWTHHRILTELGEFIAGKPTSPTVREFKRAGKGPLRCTYGGTAFWADIIGVQPPRARRRPLCHCCRKAVAA